jgi:competence protein ComEC
MERAVSRRPALKVLLPILAGVAAARGQAGGAAPALLLGVLVLIPARLTARVGGRVLPVSDLLSIVVLVLIGRAAARIDACSPLEPVPTEQPLAVVLEATGFGREGTDGFSVEAILRHVGGGDRLLPCGAPVRALLRGEGPRPLPGDRIAAHGRLLAPDRRRNPGGVSREEILRMQGLRGTFLSDRDAWRALGRGGGTPPVPALRRRIGGVIGRLYPPEAAGLIRGILLGDRGGIDRRCRDEFARAGVAHVLAISGLHVGCVAAILFLLLSLLRVPRAVAVAITLPALLLYGLLSGMPPSVRRAIAMVSGAAVAGAAGRRIDGINLLALTAAGLLLLSPGVLGNPGFRMSFLAAWGILSLLPGAGKRIEAVPPSGRPWVRRGVQILWVSVAAQLPLLPVVAGSWRMVSLVAPLTNIAVVPLMGVLFPTALASVALGPVAPWLAGVFAAAGTEIVLLIRETASLAAGLSFSAIRVAPPGPAATVAWYALLGLFARYMERRLSGRHLVIGFLLIADALVLPGLVPREPELRVTFLDVGQGDCTVFEFPEGGTLLVDAGPLRGTWDAGERVVVPFLAARGIGRIDALAVTHPQLDHFGGAPALLERIAVGRVLEPGQPPALSRNPDLREPLRAKGVPLILPRRGDRLEIGGAEIQVLHPTDAWIRDDPDPVSENEACLVLRVSWGGVSFLMTGDIGAAAEADLVSRLGGELGSDVLKVGHHGSRHSSTPAFLDAVDPAVAVVSAGRGNRFGHPDPSVLERLRRRGTAVVRTDRLGGIVFRVRGGRFRVEDGGGRTILRGWSRARGTFPSAGVYNLRLDSRRAAARRSGTRIRPD